MAILTDRRIIATVVLLLLGVSLAVAGTGPVGAQAAQTSLSYVNGASAEPVDVTSNGVVIPGLEFATASPSTVSGAGGYDVDFSDGSSVAFEAAGSVAYTVVSGAGEDDASAAAYPVSVAPIPDGQAVVVVWNATADTQLFSVNGSDPFELLSGEGLEPTVVGAGSTFTLQVGADTPVDLSITAAADSYTDLFAVFDGANLAVAAAVIPSMTDLIDAIGSSVPGVPTVPDVVGLGQDEATQTLADAGYVAAPQEQASDTVDPGIVISSDPAAGTELPVDSTVTILVSTGPATVAVPDVVGNEATTAQGAIEAAGLVATTVEQSDDEVEAGIVVETNPRAGVEVAVGTEVVITVSTGPSDVEVPDLLGLTPQQASEVAQETGLQIDIVEDADDPDPDGLVVEQDPAAGTTVAYGSVVTVQLSPEIGEAWTSIKLDPDRILTAGGINFEPGSVSDVSVLTTTLSSNAVVGDSGYWRVEIDTNTLDPTAEYEVLVAGTAADGSDYEHIFDLPVPGVTVDEPQEDDGFPIAVVLVVGLIVVAAVLLIILLVRQFMATRGADSHADGGGSADGASAPE